MTWGSKKVGDKTLRYPRQPKLDKMPDPYDCAVCNQHHIGFPFLLEGQPLCSKCHDEFESKDFKEYEKQRQTDEHADDRMSPSTVIQGGIHWLAGSDGQ